LAGCKRPTPRAPQIRGFAPPNPTRIFQVLAGQNGAQATSERAVCHIKMERSDFKNSGKKAAADLMGKIRVSFSCWAAACPELNK
jgi:hypothetical protein